MKNLNFLIIFVAILVAIVGCTPAGDFYVKPNLTSNNQIIKVGQSATITMTAPTIAVTGGNLNLTFVDTGFIYSPKINQSASDPLSPYFPDAVGFVAGSEPSFFPIDTDLEVISPVADSDNVPSRVTAVRESDLSKVTFIVKGKNVGIAVIKGGFLTSALENPNNFKRTPMRLDNDGEIILQVIP